VLFSACRFEVRKLPCRKLAGAVAEALGLLVVSSMVMITHEARSPVGSPEYKDWV